MSPWRADPGAVADPDLRVRAAAGHRHRPQLPRVGSTFHADVEAAIQHVVDVYPWFFDFRRARGGPTSYRVRNPAGYNREVVDRLRRLGFCALDDGKEIGVKTSNNFSDHFQILSSDLFVIRGLPSYRSTCFPAWDAIPPHGDE